MAKKYKEKAEHTRARTLFMSLVALCFVSFIVVMACNLSDWWILLGVFAFGAVLATGSVLYKRKHHLREVNLEEEVWMKLERWGVIFGMMGFAFFLLHAAPALLWLAVFAVGTMMEVYAQFRNRVWIERAKVKPTQRAEVRRVDKL